MQVEFWYWWVAAALLVAIEVFAPGVLFLWLGVAAAAVGLIVLVVPALGWEFQLLAFAVLSVASVYAGRRYVFGGKGAQDAEDTLNRRAEQYVGRVFVLYEPIVNGIGKARVADGFWTVEGPELKANSRVRVTGVRDGRLQVVRADDPEA
jgi:hypothetical protein